MAVFHFQTLAQAVEAYYAELRQFVRVRTGSAELADEVVQETWLKAARSSLAMPDNPRAYLYKMVSHVAIDQIRRERSVQPPQSANDDDTDESLLAQLPCLAPSASDVISSEQQFAALQQAVQELPDKCREVFLLYRGEELTMKQIASLLHISEKTVEKHLARAMLHCRQRLRDAGRYV